jgi:hypothetical protein
MKKHYPAFTGGGKWLPKKRSKFLQTTATCVSVLQQHTGLDLEPQDLEIGAEGVAALAERLKFVSDLDALRKLAVEQIHEIENSANNNSLPPLSGAHLKTTHTATAGLRKLFCDYKATAEKSAGYSEEIGRAAQFIVDPVPHDWDHKVPEFDLEKKNQHVYVKWKKGDASAVYIEADHGNGEFASMGTIIGTPFIDPVELPRTAQTWRYRLRYQHGDEQIGEWSETREITVKEQS